MKLLSETTEDVIFFAALEVYLRGVGDKKQFDYSLRDCLIVGALHNNVKVHFTDRSIKALGGRKQTVTLNQAYNRILEIRGVKHEQETPAATGTASN